MRTHKAVVVTFLAVLLATITAHTITIGGVPDGGEHPMVGQLIFYVPDALPSPFSGNTLNHLVRFAIIDGPPYNGRIASDSLVETARGDNPLVPQPVDRLTTPYLLFAADVDAHVAGSLFAAPLRELELLAPGDRRRLRRAAERERPSASDCRRAAHIAQDHVRIGAFDLRHRLKSPGLPLEGEKILSRSGHTVNPRCWKKQSLLAARSGCLSR